MAKAIFQREFHWRRAGHKKWLGVGFGARPSPAPQHFPRDFIDAAVAAGAAEAVPLRRPAFKSIRDGTAPQAETESLGHSARQTKE